jgi:hypothetical protein
MALDVKVGMLFDPSYLSNKINRPEAPGYSHQTSCRYRQPACSEDMSELPA